MTNEEKYKTKDERIKAFFRFCKGQEKKNGCLGCPTKCVPTYREQCALVWLALEAEEELLPCPFCGGEAEVSSNAFDGKFVRCRACGAISGVASSREDAIALWNRRAK